MYFSCKPTILTYLISSSPHYPTLINSKLIIIKLNFIIFTFYLILFNISNVIREFLYTTHKNILFCVNKIQ